jgi:hypothetical protein
MPNKNAISEILRVVFEISEISLLVTFYLDWRFLLREIGEPQSKELCSTIGSKWLLPNINQKFISINTPQGTLNP